MISHQMEIEVSLIDIYYIFVSISVLVVEIVDISGIISWILTDISQDCDIHFQNRNIWLN